MNDAELSRYITDTFKGVDVVVDSENTFFFYNPDPDVPPDHMFPIITLVINDAYDQYSNLSRPSVYRLNIGVSKQTFQSLFGVGSASQAADAHEYDYTALDQIMPHPEYGMMYWVCVLSPSRVTFDSKVRPLLVEAYDMAVSKYDKQQARKAEK